MRSSIYLPTPRPVQDVFFVLNESTPDLVFRIEREQADNPDNQGLMAYAASGAIPHDPYKLKPDALGPLPQRRRPGPYP
ncbi:MAG: hypothetical protein GKC10_09585 [Methanosarcinales archaeon]|nr:hypothetical protein [Methanosarcinales archaeon]